MKSKKLEFLQVIIRGIRYSLSLITLENFKKIKPCMRWSEWNQTQSFKLVPILNLIKLNLAIKLVKINF